MEDENEEVIADLTLQPTTDDIKSFMANIIKSLEKIYKGNNKDS